MLDEVNGRRFHVRKYLDRGEPLNCREKERCEHCFIEPFCTTMDRSIQAQNQELWQVWWLDGEAATQLDSLIDPLPYGCRQLGMNIASLREVAGLPKRAGMGYYLRVDSAEPLSDIVFPKDAMNTLVAVSEEQLEAWFTDDLPASVTLDVELNESTAAYVVAHQDRLATLGDRFRIHQRTHEHMKEAMDQDNSQSKAIF